MGDPDRSANQDATARDWLTLIRAPGLGLQVARHLIEQLGDATAVRAAGRSVLADLGAPPAAIAALTEPEHTALTADLDWLARPGHHLVNCLDARYPALLAEIADPPLALFVAGDPEVLSMPQIAVVGSRNPTATGVDTARAFARHLAARGITITSGLALGVDGAAHEGALLGGGHTVAVLGSGVDVIYPAVNGALAGRIAESGAVISELPPGTPPRKRHFPSRNRIISGLSVGTLVVEAAMRSGSLITARLANEQGREVFAIPGSIHNPLARGCHRLIRDGAKLVESADDIVDELGALLGSLTRASPAGGTPKTPRERAQSADRAGGAADDPEYVRLLGAIGFEPTPVDTLVVRTGLTANAVSSMLLILELTGQVSLATGGYIRTTAGVTK